MAFGASSERSWVALRYCLWAVGIAVAIHALMWVLPMGPQMFFQPQLLLTMVGPALVPTFVASIFVAVSERFRGMSRIVGIATLVFILEVGAFLIWRSMIKDEFGFSMFLLMPILGGWPLAMVAYLFAGWRKLGL